MSATARHFVSIVLAFILFAVARSQEETKQPEMKAYNNYDFVPGEKILFEDDFTSDTDGEFPAHWKLVSGQGVINTIDGTPTFVLTDGNHGKISPRIKSETYLKNAFTIKFDCYLPAEGDANNVIVFFKTPTGEEKLVLFQENGSVATGYFESDLNGTYPGNAEEFRRKWHHGALAYKNKQIKCYVDQYRVPVIPDCGFDAASLTFGGIAPVRFTKVRVADGGGMNMLDQLYKSGRLVTYGILFDVGKSTIKPASMGTINQIVKILQDKSDLKLEIVQRTPSEADTPTATATRQRT